MKNTKLLVSFEYFPINFYHIHHRSNVRILMEHSKKSQISQSNHRRFYISFHVSLSFEINMEKRAIAIEYRMQNARTGHYFESLKF